MSIVRNLRSKTGTSLIEVMVSLLIFLAGMIFVVRLFPGGFVSLKHDENITVANRLAQTEIERLQARASNLPTGIVPWGWDAYGVLTILPDTDPSSLDDQEHPLLPPADMRYYTDVNKFRRIIGEFTTIPSPSSTNLVPGTDLPAGCVYVLQFSPVLSGDINAAPPQFAADQVSVSGGILRRRWLQKGGTPPKLNSYGDYAIDYDDALLYVRPFTGTSSRWYLISYSYWLSSGGPPELRVAADIEVEVKPVIIDSLQMRRGYTDGVDILAPGSTPGSPIPLSGVLGFEGIDRASEVLAREFNKIDVGIPWDTDDPYQFKLMDPIAGVIAFNPLGYGYQEYTARGRQPLTASISYSVMDWHIMREERRIPDRIDNPSDLNAKLSIRFIKETGHSQETNGQDYAGLAPDYGITFDVMAVDIETGAWYTNFPASVVPGTTDHPAMQIDYKGGIIHFDPQYNPATMPPSPFAGKTFRIYYRADGDWAIQTYKAYSVFQRSYGVNGLDQRQYMFNAALNRLEFPPCAVGSTVAVDFAYKVGSYPEEIFASGQAQQIDLDGYIDLGTKLSKDNNGAVITITRISRVYGVSMGVRAVWRETGRGFSAGRWRKVDLETYLTRPSN